MSRTLSILFLTVLCQLGLIAKPFHVYSPSSKENTLWIVKATPKGESLKLEVAEKVKFDFSGRVITAHPSKLLLYVTDSCGAISYLGVTQHGKCSYGQEFLQTILKAEVA
jgi:hypothetical protein